MAAESKIGGSTASINGKPTAKRAKPNPLKDSQNPASDDTSNGPTTEAPITFESEFASLDLSWDVGLSFAYWPLPNLDALARREFPPPVENDHSLSLDNNTNSNHPDFPGFQSQYIFDASVAFPVQSPNRWTSPTSEGSGRNEAASPFKQQQDLDSTVGWPAHLFEGSETLPYNVDHLREPYHIRSTSPASMVTLGPGPDTHTRPSSQGSLKYPPSSPPASPPEKWGCAHCGKYFRQESILKKHARYHIRPFSCLTCNKNFSVTKDLRRHQQTLGHGGQDVRELLSCMVEGCLFKYKACRRDIYKRHYRLLHEGRPKMVGNAAPTEDERRGRGRRGLNLRAGEPQKVSARVPLSGTPLVV